MANVVNVRAELKPYGPNTSAEERRAAFRRLLGAFRRKCSDDGVQHSYKEHVNYESKSRKRRRKKKEAENARLRAKLKENFPQRHGKKRRREDAKDNNRQQ